VPVRKRVAQVVAHCLAACLPTSMIDGVRV
jgi:hypothetical protein